MEKDDDLKREIKKMWSTRKMEIIPIVVGALGAISWKLDKWIEKLDVYIRTPQKDGIAWNSKNVEKKLGRLKN